MPRLETTQIGEAVYRPFGKGKNRRLGWVLFSYRLQNYHLLLGKLRKVSTFLKSKLWHVDLSVGLASQVDQW